MQNSSAMRGFNSETSKKAHKIKSQKANKDLIVDMQKEIFLLKQTINDYKTKYHEVLEELENFKKANKELYNLSRNYPYLYFHLTSLNLKNDDPNAKYGNRFNRHLLPLYVLIGMSGEYTMSLLHQYFGFPSSRTIRNFRNALKLKYEINDQIFDGSIESIKKLVKLFKDTNDNRCVIAVDAAAVNAKITIHKDGEVEGLMNKLTIDLETMDLITSKSNEFHKFYMSHRNEIVKYFFVFYVCFLDDKNKSFPILVRKQTNGSANEDIILDLETVSAQCEDAGLDVIGLSFDGDPTYRRYVENIVNEIGKLATLNLHNPLSTLFTDYVGILIYEDMYHLVKCCRYRFVCGSRICPSFSEDDITFGIEDFKLINIKDYVLDRSKSKKMDDDLPLLFFAFENIEAAIALKRFDLVLALLPCYLLINSVLNEELTREQRIEQLTFGFSLIATYYSEYISYNFEEGKQSRSRDNGKNKHMTLYDPVWMKKYLSLTISLVKILVDERSVHLGALGTHFLEHFFGMIRRFCLSNDSAAEFEKAIDDIIIFKLLQKENCSYIESPTRRSDSGARIKDQSEKVKEIPVSVTMWRAAELMKKIGPLLNKDLNEAVNESAQSFIDITSEDVINHITYSYIKTSKRYYSTSNLKMNSTAGYTSIKRVVSGNKI